jgi:hypothetical protein
MAKARAVDDFVVQWRKMKDALESQLEALAAGEVQGERLKPDECETGIRDLIQGLTKLIEAHAPG